MDEQHLSQLLDWLENNIDVSAGMPLIFDPDDSLQIEIEKVLKGE